MRVLVDTSVFVDAERSETRKAFFVQEGSPLVGTGPLGVSVLTLSEMAFGYERNHRYSQEQKDKLLAALSNAYTVYPVTAEIAIRAGRLNAVPRQNGTPIGVADVLIAATALEFGFGVLTHNARHFSYVPDLRVFDASRL